MNGFLKISFLGLFSQEEEDSEPDFCFIEEKLPSNFNKLALKSISFHKFAENPTSRLLKAMISPKNMTLKKDSETVKINRKKAVSICEKNTPMLLTPKAQINKNPFVEKKTAKPCIKGFCNKENQILRNIKPPNKRTANQGKKPMFR